MNTPPWTEARKRESLSALWAVRRALHEIDLAAVRRLAEHGLTPAQYQLLVGIRRRADRTQQQHADAIGVTKANVSQLLDRLEQRGLVARVAEGRANAVRLTEDGKQLLGRLEPEHDAFVADQFAALGDDELTQLRRLVDRVRDG